ncbi:hypothetical protein FVI60_09050 [Campylobacter jejuni]|nr:hypothetical protein [Campylobacter jejuni]
MKKVRNKEALSMRIRAIRSDAQKLEHLKIRQIEHDLIDIYFNVSDYQLSYIFYKVTYYLKKIIEALVLGFLLCEFLFLIVLGPLLVVSNKYVSIVSKNTNMVIIFLILYIVLKVANKVSWDNYSNSCDQLLMLLSVEGETRLGSLNEKQKKILIDYINLKICKKGYHSKKLSYYHLINLKNDILYLKSIECLKKYICIYGDPELLCIWNNTD